MSRLDDPALVASEYADESRLRRRAAGYAGAGTRDDARIPLVDAVVAAAPRRVLEVGCGWGELAEWSHHHTRPAEKTVQTPKKSGVRQEGALAEPVRF